MSFTIIILFTLTALFIGFLIGFDTGKRTAPKRPVRTPLERKLRPRLSDEDINQLRQQSQS